MHIVSKRRAAFGKQYAAKFFSLDGIRRLLKNPSAFPRHARTFLFDANLSDQDLEESATVLDEAVCFASDLTTSKTTPFDEWLPVRPDQSSLAEELNYYGSDKASVHDYHKIYGSILDTKRQEPINILEIGLGTNNLDVISNMGPTGKPGASIRAFRDWAPKANVFGADVDRRILFNEHRILTFWVDQTDQKSLTDLAKELKGYRFDLIIDDGLHLPNANLRTMATFLPMLHQDGVYVVEDINCHYPIWRIVENLMSKNYDAYFAETKAAHVFVVRNKTDTLGAGV